MALTPEEKSQLQNELYQHKSQFAQQEEALRLQRLLAQQQLSGNDGVRQRFNDIQQNPRPRLSSDLVSDNSMSPYVSQSIGNLNVMPYLQNKGLESEDFDNQLQSYKQLYQNINRLDPDQQRVKEALKQYAIDPNITKDPFAAQKLRGLADRFKADLGSNQSVIGAAQNNYKAREAYKQSLQEQVKVGVDKGGIPAETADKLLRMYDKKYGQQGGIGDTEFKQQYKSNAGAGYVDGVAEVNKAIQNWNSDGKAWATASGSINGKIISKDPITHNGVMGYQIVESGSGKTKFITQEEVMNTLKPVLKDNVMLNAWLGQQAELNVHDMPDEDLEMHRNNQMARVQNVLSELQRTDPKSPKIEQYRNLLDNYGKLDLDGLRNSIKGQEVERQINNLANLGTAKTAYHSVEEMKKSLNIDADELYLKSIELGGAGAENLGVHQQRAITQYGSIEGNQTALNNINFTGGSTGNAALGSLTGGFTRNPIAGGMQPLAGSKEALANDKMAQAMKLQQEKIANAPIETFVKQTDDKGQPIYPGLGSIVAAIPKKPNEPELEYKKRIQDEYVATRKALNVQNVYQKNFTKEEQDKITAAYLGGMADGKNANDNRKTSLFHTLPVSVIVNGKEVRYDSGAEALAKEAITQEELNKANALGMNTNRLVSASGITFQTAANEGSTDNQTAKKFIIHKTDEAQEKHYSGLRTLLQAQSEMRDLNPSVNGGEPVMIAVPQFIQSDNVVGGKQVALVNKEVTMRNEYQMKNGQRILQTIVTMDGVDLPIEKVIGQFDATDVYQNKTHTKGYLPSGLIKTGESNKDREQEY